MDISKFKSSKMKSNCPTINSSQHLFSMFLLALLFTPILSHSLTSNQQLTSPWQVQIQGIARQYTISIPSTLTDILVNQGVFGKDPYYRDNFLGFYAYETKMSTWTHRFGPSNTALCSKYQYIVFEGLDTHCTVSLNDQLILQSHNMHHTHRIPVKLLPNNTLKVTFNSSALYDMQSDRQFYQTYGFHLPANYSFTRKAAYQYGWDWGPRILTTGIWKKVTLIGENQTAQIDSIKVYTTRLDPNQTNVVTQIKISGLDKLQSYRIALTLTHQGTILNTANFNVSDQQESMFQNGFLLLGQNATKYLWWTWDLGTPTLINVTVTISGGCAPISQTIRTGLRRVQVNRDGGAFTFVLNGQPLFIRGGNYIPPEMSLANTTSETYARVIRQALYAKFNMLRVWGGGQFQKDEFYDLMDEAGILIWHDLMFACAMYPSSNDIRASIEKEIRDNVRRLQRHPSIGLWNGNNQVWIGWQQWGWQKGLTNTQKYEAESFYEDIFRKAIPLVLKQEDPTTFYWQTSPSSSSNDPKTIVDGDIHFWRVWGAGKPIEQYQIYVGRFNSQYGMQSMPDMASINKFTLPIDRVLGSLILQLHQRHPLGDKYLPMYVQQYAGNTTDLGQFSYYSQVMQAYALEMAISSLRNARPYCMGSIYWQLNDVWPVSSWSTVDYYGVRKLAHYTIRHLHNQLLIHAAKNQTTSMWQVYISNEYASSQLVDATISLDYRNGTNVFWRQYVNLNITAFSRSLLYELYQGLYSNMLPYVTLQVTLYKLSQTANQQAETAEIIVTTSPTASRTYYTSSLVLLTPPVSQVINNAPILSMKPLDSDAIKPSIQSLYLSLQISCSVSPCTYVYFYATVNGQRRALNRAEGDWGLHIAAGQQFQVTISEPFKSLSKTNHAFQESLKEQKSQNHLNATTYSLFLTCYEFTRLGVQPFRLDWTGSEWVESTIDYQSAIQSKQ